MVRVVRSGAGLIIAGLICLLLAACSGRSELACVPDLEYMQSGTTDPLRIPDGLNVPDQSQSLQIPDVLPMSDEDRAAVAAGYCLEYSPAYATSE